MGKKASKDRARAMRGGRRRSRKNQSLGRPPSWREATWLPDDGNLEDGVTPSERFVTRLCRHAFLDLWTLPNPEGKQGKELCDCLVVFDDHVIIVSVKDINFKDTSLDYPASDEERLKAASVGYERWLKAAVDKSVKQLRGAEKHLRTVDRVSRQDGRFLDLPAHSLRRYHRITVSLGGAGQVPVIGVRDDGPPVHILDDHSVVAVFEMLPTISDFTRFLDALDTFPGSIEMHGGMEDLVTLFLTEGPRLGAAEGEPSLMIVDGCGSLPDVNRARPRCQFRERAAA